MDSIDDEEEEDQSLELQKQTVFYLYTGVGNQNVVFSRKMQDVSPPAVEKDEHEELLRRWDEEDIKEKEKIKSEMDQYIQTAVQKSEADLKEDPQTSTAKGDKILNILSAGGEGLI